LCHRANEQECCSSSCHRDESLWLQGNIGPVFVFSVQHQYQFELVCLMILKKNFVVKSFGFVSAGDEQDI
jgi:hypothetical protein